MIKRAVFALFSFVWGIATPALALALDLNSFRPARPAGAEREFDALRPGL